VADLHTCLTVIVRSRHSCHLAGAHNRPTDALGAPSLPLPQLTEIQIANFYESAIILNFAQLAGKFLVDCVTIIIFFF